MGRPLQKRKYELYCLARVSGMTVVQAAKAAGLSGGTGFRIERHPLVMRRKTELRAEVEAGRRKLENIAQAFKETITTGITFTPPTEAEAKVMYVRELLLALDECRTVNASGTKRGRLDPARWRLIEMLGDVYGFTTRRPQGRPTGFSPNEEKAKELAAEAEEECDAQSPVDGDEGELPSIDHVLDDFGIGPGHGNPAGPAASAGIPGQDREVDKDGGPTAAAPRADAPQE